MSVRILIAEDEPAQLHKLILELEKEGFDIIAARDGASAESKIRQERPDVVVMDILMPHKSGADICVELKADPDYRDVKIILVTSMTQESEHTDDEWREMTRADAFMTKPFGKTRLINVMEEVLGRPVRGDISSETADAEKS